MKFVCRQACAAYRVYFLTPFFESPLRRFLKLNGTTIQPVKKTPANKDKFSLFDEAELEQLLADLDLPSDQDKAESTTQEKTDKERKKPVRRPLPAHFNRVEKVIDLSGEEKATMGEDWTFIGHDTSERY